MELAEKKINSKSILLIRSNPVSPDPPVEKIATALSDNGYDVTVLAWDRESNYSEREDSIRLLNGREIKIIRFGIQAIYGGGLKKTLKALVIFWHRLNKWLKKHKDQYDIIHPFDFDTGFVAKGIARRYHKGLIYHILDFYIDSHPSGGKILRNLVKKAEISVINYADATIICTEKRIEQIKGSKPKKLIVIHNTPINDRSFETCDLKISSSSRLKIVYVGIFAEGRMLEEMCEIVSHNKDLELHIGGFGILDELIKQYAEKNDNIFYYGKLPYSATLALENQCDIMTAIYDPSIPNHRYAAPNKFYEALMLGKSIIMAKNTGFDTVIEENNLGFLVDYNQESLASCLEENYISKSNGKIISSQGTALYETTYHWNVMEKRLQTTYADIFDCEGETH